jgi:hypothetical protein
MNLLDGPDSLMRLDMLTYYNGAFEHLEDIMSLVERPLPPWMQEKPIKLVTFYDFQTSEGENALYVLSKNGTTRIHPQTYNYNPLQSLKHHFITPNRAPDIIANNIMDGSLGVIALMHATHEGIGNLYQHSPASGVRFSEPINIIDRTTLQPFDASPIFINIGVNRGWIVFDKDTRSFYIINENQQRASNLDEQWATRTGSWLNLGKDLIALTMNNAMTSGLTAWPMYFTAIMKDPVNGDMWALRALAGNHINPAKTQQNWVNLTLDGATGIEQATHFYSGGWIEENLYYVVGDKIYAYNFSLRTTHLMLDLENPNITITFFDRTSTSFAESVLIGYFNEATKRGTLAQYRQDQESSYTERFQHVQTWDYNFGRIISIIAR